MTRTSSTTIRCFKYIVLAVCSVTSVVLAQTYASAVPAQPNLAGVVCEIRVSEIQGGLRLEAVAGTHRPVNGSYRLSVVKDSESGKSTNIQSGVFQAEAAQEQIVTTVVLDRSAAGHYKAILSLKWEDGQQSCSSP